MDFRRIPFQFSSTDPAKRQAELQKRFGIPSKPEKMYIDLANPGLMGARKESNSASSSPRLQHRVPIFVEGMRDPDKSTVDANPTNVDAGQKPRVRVVPIEIEGSDGSKLQRPLSGSTYVNGNTCPPTSWNSDAMPRRSLFFNGGEPEVKPLSSKSANGPKINIPVKIEGAGKNPKTKVTTPSKKEPSSKVAPVQQNGCNVTKVSKSEENNVPPYCKISLQNICVVLEKLKGYQSDVEKFSGTVKDKQYRYLDEMLTRLMLDLDNVETMGNEEVRLSRKAAIKKVQHCVDLLESKVNGSSESKMDSEMLEAVKVQPTEVENESKLDETVPVGDCTSNVDNTNVPEVEMADVNNAQESEKTDVQMKPQEVQSMETDISQSSSVKKEIVTEVCETNENVTESNAGSSENFKAGVSVVEMKDPVNDTQGSESSVVSQMQTESSQGQSMECETAETVPVVRSDESMSELENTGKFPCDNIPDLKTDSNVDNVASQYSNEIGDDEKLTNKEVNKCTKETAENLELIDSNLTVNIQPNLSSEP